MEMEELSLEELGGLVLAGIKMADHLGFEYEETHAGKFVLDSFYKKLAEFEAKKLSEVAEVGQQTKRRRV